MTEFKVDGNMTVKLLRDSFKETFGASLRVYKGRTAGRGARPADDKVTLRSLSDKQNLEDGSEFKVSDALSIGEFEDSFLATFDLAVQVASYDDSRLLDNDMILKPGKKPKMKGEKDEDLPVKKDESIKVEPIVEKVSKHIPETKQSNNKPLILGIVGILVILIIAYFLLSGRKDESTSENIEINTNVLTEEVAFNQEVEVKFEELPFNKEKFPNQISNFKGYIEQGKYWKDKNGDNYFILTFEPTIYKDKDDESYKSQTGHGYHFCNNNTNDFTLVREFIDFVKDCQHDLTFDFLPEYFIVQDLNNNQFGEITVIYNMTCASDVSPYTIKLLMFENGEKYAIRGTTKVNAGGGEMYGGDITVDPSFNNVENSLKNYAVTQFQRAAGIK